MQIIDAHVHIARYVNGFGAAGELQAVGGGMVEYADGTRFQMFPPELGETGVSPEAVLRLMDDHNVERAVLMQGNFLGLQNGYTYEAVQQAPQRFFGVGAYDPFCRKKDAIRSHLFEACCFGAVKFEVSTGSGLMSYHDAFPLDGAMMEEELAWADAHGLIAIFDIGRIGNPCWQPQALACAARRHPNMKFVVCHLLAPQGLAQRDIWEDGLRALSQENVWFDVSSLPANQRPEQYPYPTAVEYMQLAQSIVGDNRMMFGSDIPSNLCRDTYRHLIDHILLSPAFSDTCKEAILRTTALQVYWGEG